MLCRGVRGCHTEATGRVGPPLNSSSTGCSQGKQSAESSQGQGPQEGTTRRLSEAIPACSGGAFHGLFATWQRPWKEAQRPEVVSLLKGLTSPTSEGAGPAPSPFLLPPLPRPEWPVGGRLSHFAEAWSALTADQWVKSIIDKGYYIPFSSDPPLTLSPPPGADDTVRNQTAGSKTRGPRPLVQAGDRGSRDYESRLLQPPLRSNKEEWQVPAHYRPILPKPLYRSRQIQNGDYPNYSGVHSPRRMGCLHRSQGRVSTRPHSPLVQEISALPVRGQSLPISSAPLRAEHRTLRLHEVNGSYSGGNSEGWIPSDPVLRRLAVTPVASFRSVDQSHRCVGSHPERRSDSQPGKVGFNSVSDIYLRGHVLQNETGPSLSSSATYRRTAVSGRESAHLSQLSARAFLSLLGVLNAAADLVPSAGST